MMRTTITSIISLVLLLGLPTAGWSGSLWFDSVPGEDWSDDLNWSGAGGSPDNTKPTSTDPTYITTSGTHAAFEGIAEIGATSEASGALYIGGWSSQFDVDHGSPAGHTGELRLTDSLGELTPGSASYIRVGNRGATGTLIQAGGDITLNRGGPSLGWGGDESFGMHELSSGTLTTPGVTVGIQGLGWFNMTGGTVSQSCNGCTSTIGYGYVMSEQIGEGQLPGIGLMVQSGGQFESDNINVGLEAGAVGVMFIRGTADVTTSTRFFVGKSGTGSVVQTGGEVSIGWCLEIGSQGGSIGSYTIENGTLEQTGGSPTLSRCNDANGAEGVYNGVNGVGTLTVLGDDADIDFVRYQQTAESTLAFVIDEDTVGNAVSTIQVSRIATFAVGAKIRVGVPTSAGLSITTPNSLDLLTATQGIAGITDASDLILVGPDAAEWTLSIVNGAGSEQTLVATAVP